jgi:PTS system mannose-specific IIA component
MSKVVIATHGNLSCSLKQSAELIMGTLTDVTCFAMTADLNYAEASNQLRNIIGSSESTDGQSIVLVDIYGGSPFKIATEMLIEGHTFSLITGANLPMLIEAASKSSNNNPTVAHTKISASGKNGIVTVNEEIERMADDHD